METVVEIMLMAIREEATPMVVDTVGVVMVVDLVGTVCLTLEPAFRNRIGVSLFCYGPILC